MGILRSIKRDVTKARQNSHTTNWETVTPNDIAVMSLLTRRGCYPLICIQALKQSSKQTKFISRPTDQVTTHSSEVKKEHCHAIEINPGLGKAKALVKLIEDFDLYKR